MNVADMLEEKKYYRFAEQLRASSLSMSNNIAEGSGSDSNRELGSYLNIARRSTFENANVLLMLELRGLIASDTATALLWRLDELCRKITRFKRTLLRS